MTGFRIWGLTGLSVLALASCGPMGGFSLDRFDPDFRQLGGLNTASAAAAAQPRPQADARGIISYPGYQVAVARKGDSVASIAARLGLNAAQLAQYNAIDANAVLNAGAVVALPVRVAGTTAVAPAVTQSGISDPFAGQTQGADNGAVTSKTLDAAGAGGTAGANTAAPQPRQHQVVSGETAWSIARKYGVSVNDLAKWNGLSSDMTLRVGQRLLIPVAGAAPGQTTTTAPGQGSPTPTPPSSTEPLPNEKTVPATAPTPSVKAPDMGAQRTAASGTGRFRMPVNGAIARTYQKGKNEGIDISAAPGSTVAAAGAGTVAAITRDVDQVPIIVLRHDGNLMTVYAGIDNVAVSKGQKVSAGAALGKVRSTGIMHFEVRNGFESTDPEKYLN